MTWGIRRWAANSRPPVWPSTLVALVVVSALSAALPGSALGLNCGNQTTYFMGTVESHSTTKGGEAKIAYVNEVLCSPVPAGHGTFSSYWASVFGDDVNDFNGWNIFQIGVDECKAAACPPGNPSNTPYWFWAYGRMDGPCGTEIGPEPQVISGTPSGLRLYTVVLSTVGEDHYDAKIDGAVKSTMAADALSLCWNGVDEVVIMNELLDSGTQGGGPSSNFQDFQNPRWYNGSTWQTISRTPGTTCDIPPTPARGCKWSTITPNTWRSWGWFGLSASLPAHTFLFNG